MESTSENPKLSLDSDSNSDESVQIYINLGNVNHTMSDSSDDEDSSNQPPRKKIKRHHIKTPATTESDSSEDECKIIAVIAPNHDADKYVASSSDDCPNQMQDKHVANMYYAALQSSDDRESCHSEEF